MDAIVDTMIAVDESSKKIAFSHFDQQDTNILAAQSAEIMDEIAQITQDTREPGASWYDEDAIKSDSSGNQSEADEMN